MFGILLRHHVPGFWNEPQFCPWNCLGDIFGMLWGGMLIFFTLHDQCRASDLA